MKIKINKIIAIIMTMLFMCQNTLVLAQVNSIENMLPPLTSQSSQQTDETDPLDMPLNHINKEIIEQTTPYSPYLETKQPPLEKIIPQGAVLQVQINNTIDSQTCVQGQNVEATLIKPIETNNRILIPQNSTVIGQVANVESAGRGDKNAVLEIVFNNVKTPDGKLLPLNARIKTVDNSGVLRGGELDRQLVKSAGIMAISAASGTLTGAGIAALCGAAAVGSVIGLTIGAAMGVNWIKNKKGSDIIIPMGTNLLLELTETISSVAE